MQETGKNPNRLQIVPSKTSEHTITASVTVQEGKNQMSSKRSPKAGNETSAKRKVALNMAKPDVVRVRSRFAVTGSTIVARTVGTSEPDRLSVPTVSVQKKKEDLSPRGYGPVKDKRSFYKKKLMAMNRRSSAPIVAGVLGIEGTPQEHKSAEAPGDSLDGGDTANEFYEYHDSLHT